MPKLRYLKKEISRMRRRLQLLVETHGTFHPAVIARSTELDQALNRYYRIRNSRMEERS